MDRHDDIVRNKIRDLAYDIYMSGGSGVDDLVTLRSLHYRILAYVMDQLGLSWSALRDMSRTHTSVHPRILRGLDDMLEDEDSKILLSQTFVRNERLTRIVKRLSTQNADRMDAILAVDGLSGNVSNGPNFEPRLYVTNVRFAGPEDERQIFEDEPDYRRLHVQGVRRMYDTVLKDVPHASRYVYAVLSDLIYQETNVELPEAQDIDESIAQNVADEAEKAYRSVMTDGRLIREMVKSLRRSKGEKRNSSEEDDGNDAKSAKPSKKKTPGPR